MKNARFSLWLAAAFLAGGMASWLITVPAAWAEQKKAWEYKCRNLGTSDAKAIESALNGTAFAGWDWELVTAANGVYCVKRLRDVP